jgi:4-diphosphocytidyl-2-C-methyl-D-erythritol kinase
MDLLPDFVPDFAGRFLDEENSVFISAPAKINLFLRVTGKRPDGYHDIFSWFQALDLCDHLQIEKKSRPGIEIITDASNIPTGPENLVYKAAEAMQKRVEGRSGVTVKLWKNIPVGAGLGGGSSDAAALIKGFDRLFGLRLSREEMVETGLKLGSDVPFFFSRGQAQVTGRGEIIEFIELPTDYQVALVTPPFEIRAGEAYRKLKLDLTAPLVSIRLKSCHQAQELIGIISEQVNDLEEALRESYPILVKIGDKLRETGADIVRMSGSGPTVFALYGDNFNRKNLLRSIIRGEAWGFNLARPIILPA